jgi:MFS family permease
MTTGSLRSLVRGDASKLPQYFSFTDSFWVAIFAVHCRVRPGLSTVAGRVRRWALRTLKGLRAATSTTGDVSHEAWSAAEIVAHAAARATADAARAALASLGFDHARDSRAAAWRVLKHPEFRMFFLGSVISNWGTWLQNAAQMLLAYRFSHSVLTVGLVTCAQFSTPLIFGPWASIVADRIGARRTLIVTQLASAAITALMAVLEFTQSLSEAYLFAGAFLVGLMFTFALPAQSALIPGLVPDDGTDTKAAVVMNSVAYNAGRMVAPAFTVLVVMTAGFWCVFALNALTFAVFVSILRRVRPLSLVPISKKSRVRDGLLVARGDRRIIILLLVVAAVTLAEDPVLVLGPGLARHTFHLSYDCSGYFLCALGAGSVITSLLPRRKMPSTRRAAAALGLLGISIVTFALAPWMWLSVAAAFSAGLCGLVAGSAAQAMLRHLAGRERALQVMGLWAVAWAGSKPFASLLDGLLPSVISVQATGVVMAIPALLPPLVLLVMPVLARQMISYRRPAQAAQEHHWPSPLADSTGEKIAA